MAHIQKTHSGLWVPQSTHEKIDSQKMFIDNIEKHEENYLNHEKRLHANVNSITELKALTVPSATITNGTMITVVGSGVYHYSQVLPPDVDEETIVIPDSGTGYWIPSGGSGGGNLIVDDTDYGEDTDSDQSGAILKIKKLFNKKLKKNFFPVTTTKAVRDTSTGKSLFQLLGIIPTMDDGGEEVSNVNIVEGNVSQSMLTNNNYNGVIYTLLADKWVEFDDSYKQTIIIPSLGGTESLDISLYDDGSVTEDQTEAFDLITGVNTDAGEVVVVASEKPQVSLNVIIKGAYDISEVVIANLSEVANMYDIIKRKYEELMYSLIKTVDKVVEEFDASEGSNILNISLDGYKPIAVAYAMIDSSDCDVIGTAINNNNLDIRLSAVTNATIKYGIIYLKQDVV